jgi:tight adherence protein C
MSTLQIIFVGIIFVTVTAAAMMFLLRLAPGPARRRLESVADTSGYAEAKARSDWTETVVKLAGSFAKLSLPSEGWEQSPLRLRFIHAGYRGNAPVALYFGAKTLLAVLFPALAYLYLLIAGAKFGVSALLLILLSAAALGYYLPNVVLSRLVFLRQREIFESFPDAADLMLVCVESGLGLDAALVKVTEEIRIKSVALAEELHLVNLEMRAGGSRDKALRNLALRTGVEEVNSFVTMLVQADRFGTSIGESLRVFSDELRTKRKLRAEELAAKIPLKLLFPLIFFIFPSLLLVLLGPAFIQVYRILLPTMAGR